MDHERAMLVFDCHDQVSSLAHLFDAIDELNRQLTDDIIKRRIPYQEELDDRVKDLCRRWLVLARDMRDGLLAWCKQRGNHVDGELSLLSRIAEAEKSEANGFDVYAIERSESIRLPMNKLREMQSPMATWPD